MEINYKKYSDLVRLIKKNIYKIEDFDLFVGIPRSGLLPANIMALYLNKPVCTVSELRYKIVPQNGFSRQIERKEKFQKILIVDDSINTGKSINYVKDLLKDTNFNITFCAVYATEKATQLVDIFFEVVPKPRIFQWNYLNNSILLSSAVLFEGVICKNLKKNNSMINLEKNLEKVKANIFFNAKLKIIFTGYSINTAPLITKWLNNNNIYYEKIIYNFYPSFYEKIDQIYIRKLKEQLESINLLIVDSSRLAKTANAILNIPAMDSRDELFQ